MKDTDTTTAPAVDHADMANAIRLLAADAVQKAKSGHPGMPMGMADVATVLFTRFLKYDAADPSWPDRDRFVLSAGHGSMLLYSLMYLTGYPDMTLEQIRNFRQLGSITAGHPEHGHASGAETTTGPLGQGLANAVGMALAEKLLAARFGADAVDHRTYVIAGDGCLMEGISHEAISLAGHLKLNKLMVLFDDNQISIDGPTTLSVSDDQQKRFEASGWNTWTVDGHDPKAIAAAIAEAQESDKPAMIACRTIIGFGAPTLAGTAKTHGAPLGDEEIKGAREKLGWSHAPFVVPGDVLESWRAAGRRSAKTHAGWSDRIAALPVDKKSEFTRLIRGDLPIGWEAAVNDIKKKASSEKPKMATRQASQTILEALTVAIPEMVGGSADLTGSNNTKTAALSPITASDFSGRYVYYGVREHGMAAAMNGMALHGGTIPYGGTFLVFTDYCRPSIRLSALMGQRVIYVMTHDSIGLGEDGPTHQPVEHLAALRAIPNLLVMRPCDVVETAECWAIAVADSDRPSILALTRQGLPTLRTTHTDENLCLKGGYVLAEASGDRQATLIATGSEVSLAVEARAKLEADGISTAVISLPCWELFDAQSEEYRKRVLGSSSARVAIEAAGTFGWERYVGESGCVIGMKSFGASAPAPALYEHFGITADAAVNAVKARL
jgi:transketolase